MSFDETALVVGGTPAAARQLASRARRRVRVGSATPDPDLNRQRAVVDALLAASRGGNFEVPGHSPRTGRRPARRHRRGLVGPFTSKLVRGARTVAGQALAFPRFAEGVRPELVNRAMDTVTIVAYRPVSVTALTIVDGRITGMSIVVDPVRLSASGPGRSRRVTG
ncbi:hypothetical protein [Streptomyces sp. C36]|uniref:hypothetical protein n=1 Tax=Streptomyces sp. C36 TaxID=3237122 RepID=UPI0034C5BD01